MERQRGGAAHHVERHLLPHPCSLETLGRVREASDHMPPDPRQKVAGVHSGLGSWTFRSHRRDEEADTLSNPISDADPQPRPAHMAKANEFSRDLLDRVGGDGEANSTSSGWLS